MEVDSINQDQWVNSRMSFESVMYVRTLESTAESVFTSYSTALKANQKVRSLKSVFFLKHGLNELFQ